MISTSKIVQKRTISRPRIRSVVAIALVGLAAPAALAAGPGTVAGAAPASTPCAAVPDGATLVVGTASGYAVARANGVEDHPVALAEPATKAVRTADGSVWVEMGHGEATSVARVLASGEAVVGAAPEARLSGVGWIGERPAVAIVDADESHAWRGDSDAYGAVLVEFTDGTQVDVAPAGGPEYGVGSATIGDGRVLVGAFSDLAEVFRSFDIDGNELSGVFSPTDRAPYNAPPLYLWPAAAADASGSTWLTWVEGPDANGVTGEVVDRWALVVADATTGQERLRLDLGDPGSALLHADFDGRTWVGTFDTSEAADAVGQPGRVVVVDTTAATPIAVDAACVPGTVATLDRAGLPAPAPAPGTAPACASYRSNDRYPLRRCDKGPAVAALQRSLVASGAAIDVDGYFGPATDAAVRAFQRDAGLEVDGLVGTDTWSALRRGHWRPPAPTPTATGSSTPGSWRAASG